ncbi:uncharacterized protein [Ptychodera flava]|uniref:uncharacterized protein n=1 Tax=Ptychodera flava TaxID=63121 RepID=UPI003969CC6C
MKNSDPQVSTEQLLAMLLCFVRGHMCDSFLSENASSVLAKAEETEFQSNPINCRPYNQTAEAAARSESDGRQPSFLGTNQEMKIDSKMSSPCVTKDRLHGESACAGKLHFNSDPSVKFGRISERHLSLVQACAQWQSCMQYATYLNTILRDPFPKPDVTKLYHGTEISTTYYALIKLDLTKQKDWIHRYLQMVLKSKRAAEMFDQMYEVVSICCKEVEPQLPALGRFSEILPEDYVESAANVFKQKGYSVPTYGHIDEKDERVICFNCGELDHKSPACSRPKNQCSLCEKWGHNSNSVPQLKRSTGTSTRSR